MQKRCRPADALGMVEPKIRGSARPRTVAGIVAWVVFGLAWLFVLTRPGAALLSPRLLVIPGTVLVVMLITTFWVRHNRRIYARKGPRTGLPAADDNPTHDRLGRAVRIDLPSARQAREVVVDLDDHGKSYRVAQ